MSYKAGFLQNFGGFIAAGVAAGALVVAFKVSNIIEDFTKGEEPKKPDCTQVDKESGLKMYDPQCK